MRYTLSHNLGQEEIWNLFTTNEFTEKWLATESSINWKKNGRIKVTVETGTHEVKGCKIIEFEPFETLRFTWKGPDDFDITMNFEDYLTHITVTFNDQSLILDHEGWRSSEDWQEAKDWHEKVFWPEKIAKLSNLIKEY